MQIAQWSDRDPKWVTVVDETSGERQQLFLDKQPSGDRPSPGMLRPLGLSAYPGTEWRQEGPGDSWLRAVHPV